MVSWMLFAGLGLSLGGAIVAGLADAWLSRSVLIYLDALEHNLRNVARTMQAGGPEPNVTEPNLRRDRGQNQARTAKSLGWVALALGLACRSPRLVSPGSPRDPSVLLGAAGLFDFSRDSGGGRARRCGVLRPDSFPDLRTVDGNCFIDLESQSYRAAGDLDHGDFEQGARSRPSRQR